MIKGYRLFVRNGKLCISLLEYGSIAVSIERVGAEVEGLGIKNFNREEIACGIDTGDYTVLDVAMPPPLKVDGACWAEIDNKDKSVKIHLYPPHGEGAFKGEKDVLNEIKASGCEEWYIFTDIIQRNMEQYKKQRAITIFKAAELRDAELIATITEDRRTAYLAYLHPWGGTKPTLEQAKGILAAQSVCFGIDEVRLKEILENNRDVEKQRIAGAQDPVKGTDAVLKYLFDAYHLKTGPVISTTSDRANFRELNLFETVETGAILVQKTPLTQGEDGYNVSGQVIKAESGKDVQLPRGKNTEISGNDVNILVATKAGTPRLIAGKVIIDETLVVNDVDFSTGNITFNGDVLVKGIVNQGFTITAEGSITCTDTVEAADLIAGVDIFLKRGIKGMGKSRIEAGNNVHARFIERGIVTAGNSVIVDEELIHSETMAANTVEATNSKGRIFGGSVKAGNLVRASYIGSEMAVKTVVEVGVAPNIKAELDELSETSIHKQFDFERSSKNLAVLAAMKTSKGLTVEKEELYQQLGHVSEQLKSEIEQIAETIALLENALEQCSAGRIEAVKFIYPGVMIKIKNLTRRIDEPIQKAIFLKEGPDIVLSVNVPECDRKNDD